MNLEMKCLFRFKSNSIEDILDSCHLFPVYFIDNIAARVDNVHTERKLLWLRQLLLDNRKYFSSAEAYQIVQCIHTYIQMYYVPIQARTVRRRVFHHFHHHNFRGWVSVRHNSSCFLAFFTFTPYRVTLFRLL